MTDQRDPAHRRCTDCGGTVPLGRWRCEPCQANRRPLTRDIDAAGVTRLSVGERTDR